MRQLSIISHDQKPDSHEPGAISSNHNSSNPFDSTSKYNKNLISIDDNNDDIIEEIECDQNNLDHKQNSCASTPIILKVNNESNFYNNNSKGDKLNCIRF